MSISKATYQNYPRSGTTIATNSAYTPEAARVGHPQRELMVAAVAGKFEEQGWRVRKDGSRFWAHIVIVPILDDRGDVEGFGKITRDITETKQATEQMANVTALLEATSRTDFLTGLENRRSLDSSLAASLAAAAQHGSPLVVAMVDIDGFKHYNDTCGHVNGDRYLRKAAGAWRKCLRAGDTIARYGGEEFVILMHDIALAPAVDSLDRIREATPQPLSCSIGATEWDRAETSASLINRAERMLDTAKAGGRNRVEALAASEVAILPAEATAARTKLSA